MTKMKKVGPKIPCVEHVWVTRKKDGAKVCAFCRKERPGLLDRLLAPVISLLLGGGR